MTFDFRYPTPLPSTKGWGPGWPDCQDVAREGRSSVFVPGVHRAIAELVGLLVLECEGRGFRFLDPGCWGFGCRATKSSSGSQGGTPSFHSWGLGIDINAPLNPFGADRERTQLGREDHLWLTALMHVYGFFWLGPPIKDWMHYSFCGSPSDAAAMLAKAKINDLGGLMESEWHDGEQAYREAFTAKGSDPGTPPDGKSARWRDGWASARFPFRHITQGGDTGGLRFGDTVKLTKP